MSIYLSSDSFTVLPDIEKDILADQNEKPGNQVNISDLKVENGNEYVIKDYFKEGSVVYTDRDYFITSVPSGLSGFQYIMTANSDKLADNADFLSFAVNQPVNVYIAHDVRYEKENGREPPPWLTKFLLSVEVEE